MPSFRYEAADEKGRVVTGTMEGESRHEIIDRLKQQGYVVRGVAGPATSSEVLQTPPPTQTPSPQIHSPQASPQQSQQPVARPVVQPHAAAQASEPLQRAVKSERRPEEAPPVAPQPQVEYVTGWVNERDLYFFFAQLASLLRAGLAPVEAMNGLSQRVRQRVLAQAAREMAEAAVKGVPMSKVMEHYQAFPSHAIGGIRAGELSGFLPEAAEELASQFQTSVSFRRHFWVTRIFGWNLVLTVLFMLPAMPAFWHTLKAGLSTPQEVVRYMLMDYARGLVFTALPAGLVLFCGYYLGKALLWKPKLTLWRHALLLKVPFLGSRAAQESMRVFSFTLRNNVAAALSPDAAWNAAAAAVPNAVYRQRFLRAGQSLREGANIDQAALDSGLFTHDQIALLQTGKQAGDMVGMLEHLTRQSAFEFDVCQSRAKWEIWGMAIVLLTIATGVMVIMFAQGYFGNMFKEVDKIVN